MKLRAIASVVGLATAIALTGPVAAQQYMLDGEQVPVDQVDNFKEACEGLRAANNASLTIGKQQIESDDTTTGSITTDPADSASSPDPAAQEKWTELLATLDREDCETMGFYGG